ncbi:uncharacterized protein [Henckelia pumila]|uniref:uncharacterized protein n=1 Tax=Henckelia pumila TaxID=405737 RepID=UPI003C6E5A2C
MADNRTVLDIIRPPTEGYGFSIVRLTVEANNFELKSSIIQMIQLQAIFGGTSVEDPYAHLERFLSICDTFKANGSQQTQTFYNGADQSVRFMLDVAANGSLFRNTPTEAWEIIEKMAESNIRWPDVKKEKKAGVLEFDALTALNVKIDALTHQMAIIQTAPTNQVQTQ